MAKVIWAIIAASFLTAGCVAPGSAIGSLDVRVSLTNEEGLPLAGERVDFTLPAAYGLGGLDMILNEPEDFGHSDRAFSVTTDVNGEASYSLGEIIYHISFWMLPPLGAKPDRPPPPFLFIRVQSQPNEYYAVQSGDGQFWIYGVDGVTLALEEASLSGLEAYNTPNLSKDVRGTIGVFKLVFPSQ